MDLASALLELWARKVRVVLCLLASIAVGLLIAYELQLSPELGLKSRAFAVGVGDTSVLIDSKGSAIETLVPPTQTDPYSSFSLLRRSQALARLMDQQSIKERISEQINVPAFRISVQLPVDPAASGAPRPEPGAGARASQIVSASEFYQLSVQDSSQAPVIRFLAQAPDAQKAVDLADAAARALQDYVSDLELRAAKRRDELRELLRDAQLELKKANGARQKLEAQGRIDEIEDEVGTGGLVGAVGIQVRRSSRPSGGVVSQGTNVQLAVAGSIVTFVVLLLLLLVAVGAARGIRSMREAQDEAPEERADPDPDAAPDGDPPPESTGPPAHEPDGRLRA